jgi:hypothetical protein
MVALVIAVSSCATGGEDNWNSTAVGDDKSIGALDLRSVLLVTGDEGAAARILGTFENNTDQPIDLTRRHVLPSRDREVSPWIRGKRCSEPPVMHREPGQPWWRPQPTDPWTC